MPSANNTQTTPAPDPWYVQIASYKDGVKGATYAHASGVELKTFMGWTKTVILGVKSEIVIGGSVSTLMGGAIKTTLCADWNIQKGLKKDTSWGNKREWRKGDISLRCIGKKEDFVFSQDDLTRFSPVGSFTAAKTAKTRVDNERSTNLAQTIKLETVRDAVAQIHNEFSNIREISTSSLKLNATASANIKAASLDLAAVNALSLKAASVDIAAPSVNVKGKVSLGGVVIPNLATAAELAKLQAKLSAQNAKIIALKAQGAALYAKAMTQLLPT